MEWKSLINKKYIIDLNKNYLLLEVLDTRDSYKTHMLEENDIPGLLGLNYSRIDNIQQFMYEISSMQTMDKMLSSKKAGYEDIKRVIYGIYGVCENIKKFFLKADNLIINPDMIYINPETMGVKLVLNPYYNEPIWQQLRELSRYFIGKINYTDIEAVTCVYKFNEIVMQDSFILEDIIKALEVNIEEKTNMQEEIYIKYDENIVEEKKQNLFEKLAGLVRNRFQTQIVCEEPSEYKIDNQEEYEFKEEIGNTVLMRTCKEKEYYLESQSPKYENIKIPQEGVIIGKLEKNVDVIINDISISRIHAKLEKNGDKCYIEDLNTTNGTYINGRRLIPYKLEELSDGDKINLGCIEYVINKC